MPDQPSETAHIINDTSSSSPAPPQPPSTSRNTGPPIELIVPDAATAGKLFYQPIDDFVLCPPHLMPLKSVTLEKLEHMQRDAQLQLKETRARTAAAAATDAGAFN